MPALRPIDRLLAALRERTGDRVRAGLVSDIHGQHTREAIDLFVREAGIDLLLCCGDLQDYRGGYPAPMVFITGNHECFEVVDRMDAGDLAPPGLAHLPDAEPVTIAGVRVAGLGGCWSPSGKGGRKHVTQSGIDRLTRHHADIVLTHDTPIHFGNGQRERTVPALREAMLGMAPRIWAAGHHHYRDRERAGRTDVLSLGKWPHTWAVVELDRGRVGEPAFHVPADPAYREHMERWRAWEAAEKELLFAIDRAGRPYGTDEPGMPRWRP